MKPIIVAELSANHNGSLDTALELVAKCANAGASAIKLQTWTPDRMVVDPTLVVQSGPWKGWNMMEMYRKAHTPWEWHQPIFDLAKDKGMDAFSSVFDLGALDFLESIGCPRYKIASFECTDLPLIEAVAQTKKPMIISTGMANWPEIVAAIGAAQSFGCTDLTMLKCTSAYPAPAASANLKLLERFWKYGKFGLSDHTMGIGVAIAAVALGASMIEKHVALSRKAPGLDSAFSAEPADLKRLVDGCNEAYEALGNQEFGLDPAEADQRQFRRSWYAVQDVKTGTRLQVPNIATARPAKGILPADYRKLLNRRAKTTIKAGEAITFSMLR